MKVGILGTGAYGVALSTVLCTNKHEVVMWTKFEEEKKYLEEKKEAKTLPGIKINDNIRITTNIEECVKDKDIIFIAIPAAFIDDTSKLIKKLVDTNTHICIASKGIEQETGLFLHQIVEKNIDTRHLAVISGPTFAIDIVTGNPCALSLASYSEETTRRVQKALANHYLKLRSTNDVIGVETCGAIKNVIAIASGIISGLGANDSTRAMLITEALHDMKTIIDVFDGDPKTVLSFAGFGDLLLTCTSYKSRNFSFGKLLGSNATPEEIKNYLKENTVEGLYTVKSIYKLLKDKKANVPIIDLIYNICNQKEKPDKLLTFLVEKI